MDSLYQHRVAIDIISGGAMQAYAPASRADIIVLLDSLEELVSPGRNGADAPQVHAARAGHIRSLSHCPCPLQ